jgi:ABC-type nitrate/sulfonate/bicarbonate transport system substrate-binding protein
MPRHQFRRALATCLMIASALLALLPESVAAEQRAVRFRMDWIPSGMYAPFFYGYDAGVFAKNGIDLDIVNGNGSLTTISDVDAGNVKFGMSGCAAAALAISKGRKIISIASYMAKYSWAFYVPEDSAFKNIGDLRGKSVVVAPNSSEILLLPAVLKYAGVNPEDVKRVAVDPAQKIATYARGVGDSTITTMAYGDPLVQQAKPSRALLWSDAGFVMPDYCVIASTDTVAKDPELVASFLKATFESVAASEKKFERCCRCVSEAPPTYSTRADREAMGAHDELPALGQHQGVSIRMAVSQGLGHWPEDVERICRPRRRHQQSRYLLHQQIHHVLGLEVTTRKDPSCGSIIRKTSNRRRFSGANRTE